MLRRKQPQISKKQALNAIPICNRQVKTERDEHGNVVLTISRRADAWGKLLGKIFFTPPSRRLVLDEIGTYVWERCDGRHTVRALIDSLSKRYKLNRREAEISLTTFLRSLGQKGLVAFAVEREASPTQEVTNSAGHPDGKSRKTD